MLRNLNKSLQVTETQGIFVDIHKVCE